MNGRIKSNVKVVGSMYISYAICIMYCPRYNISCQINDIKDTFVLLCNHTIFISYVDVRLRSYTIFFFLLSFWEWPSLKVRHTIFMTCKVYFSRTKTKRFDVVVAWNWCVIDGEVRPQPCIHHPLFHTFLLCFLVRPHLSLTDWNMWTSRTFMCIIHTVLLDVSL